MAAQIEQLHRTKLRLAVETALGNGTPEVDAEWLILATMGAAIEREIRHAVERLNVFGQPNRREVVAQSWRFKTAHEASRHLVEALLIPEFRPRVNDRYTLDPEAVGPSYVLETISEAGDSTLYKGAKIQEVVLIMEERRIVRMEIGWIALSREPLNLLTPADRPEREIAAKLMPTNQATVAITNGTWELSPRNNNTALVHGGQMIFTREIEPTNFGPDGEPSQIRGAAWQVMVELYMPETPGVTDSAFADEWLGRLAVWLGTGPQHFRIEAARGFIDDEDLVGWDWRTRRLVAKAESDDRRCLVEFRA